MIDLAERAQSTSHRSAGRRWRLSPLRAAFGLLGITLLLLGGSMRGLQLSPILTTAAFLALLAATLIGGVEGWPTRGERQFQQDPARQSTEREATARRSRIGLAIVGITSTIAVQSWFEPGRLLASGDTSPVIGTAWLGRIFAAWWWSGSNLGGPAANETALPWAGVYWLVHALHGSPGLAERIWYSTLFVGAAVACYLLLRILRIGPAGATIGALSYVFNAHIVDVGTNPVFLAATMLLPALLGVVLAAASGRWSQRRGIILFAASAPILGYVSMNPPLVLMIGVPLATAPFLMAWIDGQESAYRALRVLAFGGLLLAFASSYWIIPTILQVQGEATSALASQASWTWSEGRANLANGFWLNNDWGWKFAEYEPFAGQYARFPLLTLKYLYPASAFAFLVLANFSGNPQAVARRARLGIAASITALILVLISTGTMFPGSIVFDPLYNLPFGWLLREPGRFLILAGLAYSVLLGLTADAIADNLKLFTPFSERGWRPTFGRPGLRVVGVGAIGLAILVPGLPLMTGAVAPDHRPVLPPSHVRVPPYWLAMAAYLNGSAPPGNLLVLPQDDFYQMPYTWGYYGADAFITDMIRRNVVDPVTQGYAPAGQELANAVTLVQQALLAHDWSSVRRTLDAIGTPLLLVRGDVNASFPGRQITNPLALDRALSADPAMQLVGQYGKLELFALHSPRSPTGFVSSYATVNSATPDLRDLSLLPAGTSLVTESMQTGVPAVLQLPPVSRWQLVRGRLETSIAEPPGRKYEIRLLSPTGALTRPDIVREKRRNRRRGNGGHSQADKRHRRGPRLTVLATHRGNQVVEGFSYKLSRSELANGNFASGNWGSVGNCAAFPGTAAMARLSARLLPSRGPAGQTALALSAHADSACEGRLLAWRSGPFFVSLWERNISGAAPRICFWQTPIKKCAVVPALPSNRVRSRWYHYQTIVAPVPGTRSITLVLYADVYTVGTPTTNEYSDIIVRRAQAFPQPVILATARAHHAPAAPLYSANESFSPEWASSRGERRVKIDGLRNGWLGASSSGPAQYFRPMRWDVASRIASMVTAFLLLAIALPFRRNRLTGRHPRRRRGHSFDNT